MKFWTKGNDIFSIPIGVFHSFSQIFFSNNPILSSLIFISIMLEWKSGLAGLYTALFCNSLAYFFGFEKNTIRSGYWAFNGLLTGLALGGLYQWNGVFWLMLSGGAILCLLITVWLHKALSNKNLPFLSLPFTLSVFIIILASTHYNALQINLGNTFILNDLYSIGGLGLVGFYEKISSIYVPEFVSAYFKSLGAIMFRFNLLSGILIAIGILIHSRIAFVLSWVGFSAGYFFYKIVGGDFTQLHYSFLGFNFILSAIAIGGFFVIPSKSSFISVLLVTPAIAMLIAACASLLGPWQLPALGLPFNIISILVLFLLEMLRSIGQNPNFVKVDYQTYSPEKNLYNFLAWRKRFGKNPAFSIQLPFFGFWKVSQGYDGKITHRGEWKQALDFVIEDRENKTFRFPGTQPEHFYCYNLPVLAVADGKVEAIIDDVEDNEIGDANYKENWGNSIVLKHSNFLYSQISHIKKGSFRVRVGDTVKKGAVLAVNGNSGRSPEPHIHFQMQATPFIGSATLAYPLGHYVVKKSEGKNDKYQLKSFSVPNEGEEISNISINRLLKQQLHFQPGRKLLVEKISQKGYDKLFSENTFTWAIAADWYNRFYIFCDKQKASAYFYNDDTFHVFNAFEGEKESVLHYFYLAFYRVMMGFYPQLSIEDEFPLTENTPIQLRVWQDFIAPFGLLMKNNYHLHYQFIDSENMTSKVKLMGQISWQLAGKKIDTADFQLTFEADKPILMRWEEGNDYFEISIQ